MAWIDYLLRAAETAGRLIGQQPVSGTISMPNLGFTDYLEVVMRAGPPKASKLAELKHRAPYSPATDFYKGVREAIVETHSQGRAKAYLTAQAAARATDARKAAHYPVIAAEHARWWGRKILRWFDPPRATWSSNGVSVAVNPEIGLTINGTDHVIKLHFKDQPVARHRIAVGLELMGSALATLRPGAVLAILDVRRRRIHAYAPDPLLPAQLVAESAYIASLWPHL